MINRRKRRRVFSWEELEKGDALVIQNGPYIKTIAVVGNPNWITLVKHENDTYHLSYPQDYFHLYFLDKYEEEYGEILKGVLKYRYMED